MALGQRIRHLLRQPADAAIALLLAYFAARLVILALSVDPAVPPDETTHVGRVLAFASTWGWPASDPSNYAHGLLGHRPFLYSWLMARLLALNVLPIGDLAFLRLANAALALATVGYGIAFVRTLTDDPLARVLFAALLTNTMMFTGIGAAVSYDNLTNLAAAAGATHALRYLRVHRPGDLAWLALFCALGCLSKRSFLPLAAILALAILIPERRRLPALLRDLVHAPRPLSAPAGALLIGVVLLYGSNLALYGRLVPGFDQVVGVENALRNRIFARDHLLAAYREGRIGLEEAIARTRIIEHEADRASARFLLTATGRTGERRLAPHVHAWLWSQIMLDRAYGYFGHRVLSRRPWERGAYALVLVGAVPLFAFGRRRDGPDAWSGVGWSGSIALAYALVLLVLVNGANYRATGLLDAGVQGRYLFPVAVPLYGFTAASLARGPAARAGAVVAVLAAAFFVWGDGPSFLLATTPAWFGAAGG